MTVSLQVVFDSWFQSLPFLMGDDHSEKGSIQAWEKPNISSTTTYFLNSTATDLSVQELALKSVWWHGERLTCGLAGKLWGFQTTPLGFEWIVWLGNTGVKNAALVSTDSGGCGCAQPELSWSVILSLFSFCCLLMNQGVFYETKLMQVLLFLQWPHCPGNEMS